MLYIYTGEGKGKTTAAAGLAIRAIGWNKKVLWCSFYKKTQEHPYYKGGELKILHKLGVKIYHFPTLGKDEKEDLKRLILKEKPQVLILDEINLGLFKKDISSEELIEIIDEYLDDIDIIMTGRYCDDKLATKADLVSYIAEVKHPYSEMKKFGTKGIDY